MSLPDATREDIEQNESLDILVRVESETTAHGPVERQYVVTDHNGSRFGLAIFERLATYTLESDRWYVLENASGNVYNGKPELRSNFGSMTVKAVADPPDSVTTIGDGSTEAAVRDGGVLAFDIETISTVSEADLDLGDSTHLELLCIGVGYRPEPDVPIESDVLFRRDSSQGGERDLLAQFCDWVADRDPSLLITYNGTGFDLPHLHGRADAVADSADGADGIDERIRAVLDGTAHEDLYVTGPLESAASVPTTHWDAYAHDMNPADWRREQRVQGRYPANRPLDDTVVVAGDVPYFGRRFLELRTGDHDTSERRALRRLLAEYAGSDVEPLFELR